MADGIFNQAIFNDDIFNTHAAPSGVGGVNDMAGLAPPIVVKPWKKGIEKPTRFEFLIVAEPKQTKAFHIDLATTPYHKQIRRKLLTFWAFTQATTEQRVARFIAFPQQQRLSMLNFFSGARLYKPWESIKLQAKPVVEQKYHKTLYGKAEYGVFVMRLVDALSDS